jgi:hypothetical protein
LTRSTSAPDTSWVRDSRLDLDLEREALDVTSTSSVIGGRTSVI